MTTTQRYYVKVNERTHRSLIELANQRGESVSATLEHIVERHRRERLLKQANVEWARVLADPVARAEVEAEDALWDGTFNDELEPY